VSVSADPIHHTMLFTSSCNVPCDVLLSSVCQEVIDYVPGETHEITVVLMHVDELVYAVVAHNITGSYYRYTQVSMTLEHNITEE